MGRPGHRGTARLAALGAAVVTATAGVPPASPAPPTYRRVSGDTFAATETRVSGNGRFVVYVASPRPYGEADPKDLADSAQVYVADLVTGRPPELVSVSTRGTGGNHDSRGPSISADGRYVVFASDADNLVPGDTNGVEDVFLRDRKLGRTTRVSVDVHGREVGRASDGGYYCGRPAISADGSTIAFFSRYNLTSAPLWNSNLSYLYVVPRAGVPARAKPVGRYVDGSLPIFDVNQSSCRPAAISASGRYIAARVQDVARAKPGGGYEPLHPQDKGVFVYDVRTGAKRFLRASPPFAGSEYLRPSPMAAVTMDGAGTKVVYEESFAGTEAHGLRSRRLVLWNLRTGSVAHADGIETTVARPDLGVPGADGGKYSYPAGDHAFGPALSGNGRYLVFTLADYGTDAAPPRLRALRRDLVTGSLTPIATCEPLPPEACGESYAPSVSDTGAVVAFVSTGQLAADDPDAPSSWTPPPGTDPEPYAEKADRVLQPADVYVLR